MRKVTALLLSLTILFFLVTMLFNNNNALSSYNQESNKTYLNIVATNKLQYQMIKQIVGNKHNVQYLFKDEDELFNYNKDEKTVLDDINADVFFYVGDNYEPWVNSFISKMDKNVTTVLDMSRGIRSMKYSGSEEINPYYWTSSKEYLVALYNIKATIEDRDPANKDYYEDKYKNAVKSIKKRIEAVKLNKDNSEYTFISIDDKLDYFYKELNISIRKYNKDKIKQYIEDNNLDAENVVILKDFNTDFEADSNIKVINLYSYSCDMLVEDMIVNNYKQIYGDIK